MMEAICIFILVAPAVSWKLWKDRNGFDHKSNGEFIDTSIIILISIFFAGLPYLDYSHKHSKYWDIILYFKCLAVSITGFQLFFTYLMNWRLSVAFGNWRYTDGRLLWILNHLSAVAIPDKWVKGIHWSVRLAAYIAFFVLSIIWFVW